MTWKIEIAKKNGEWGIIIREQPVLFNDGNPRSSSYNVIFQSVSHPQWDKWARLLYLQGSDTRLNDMFVSIPGHRLLYDILRSMREYDKLVLLGRIKLT